MVCSKPVLIVAGRASIAMGPGVRMSGACRPAFKRLMRTCERAVGEDNSGSYGRDGLRARQGSEREAERWPRKRSHRARARAAAAVRAAMPRPRPRLPRDRVGEARMEARRIGSAQAAPARSLKRRRLATEAKHGSARVAPARSLEQSPLAAAQQPAAVAQRATPVGRSRGSPRR